MARLGTTRPRLKTTYKEKVENDFEYCKQWMEYIIASAVYLRTEPNDLKNLYDVSNNYFDEAWFNRITNPFNLDREEYRSQTKIEYYNIIFPIVQKLIGEKLGRPFNYQVTTRGSDSEQRRVQKELELIKGYIEQEFINAVAQEDPRYQEEVTSQQPIDKQVKEFKASYKDELSIMGQDVLDYILQHQRVEEKLKLAFEHWVKVGEGYTYAEVDDNELKVYPVSPYELDYEKDGESAYVEDGDWAVRRMFWSPNKILDHFYDDLTEEQVERIQSNSSSPFYSIFENYYSHYNDNDYRELLSRNQLEVIHCTWRVFTPFKILKYYSQETMSWEEMEVDESYKLTREDKKKGYELTTLYRNEVWEGYRIDGTPDSYSYYDGSNIKQYNVTKKRVGGLYAKNNRENGIYLRIRPIPYQRTEVKNRAECKLPYIGKIWSNLHSKPMSITKLLLPYQKLYVIMWYRLERAIAKSKGKMAVMFTEMIPQGEGKEGWTKDDWLYYSDELGIMLTSAAQLRQFGLEGQGINNLVGNYNQSQLDEAQFYIQILEKIQRDAYNMIGFNDARLGQTSASDSVGAIENKMLQSNSTTENLFYEFENIEYRLINSLLDLSKYAYKDGLKAEFIRDDNSIVFLDLDVEKHMSAEYGVFAVKSSIEQTNLNSLKDIAIQKLSTQGNPPSVIAEIIDSNNYKKLKVLLKEVEEQEKEFAQQQAQSEQQAQQELEQIKAENEKAMLQLQHEMDMALESLKIQGALEQERIRQEFQYGQFKEAQDLDGDGRITEAEILQQELERSKLAADISERQKDRELEALKTRADLEKTKYKEEKGIEKEKIKAETALKNKVAGEK